MIHPGTTDTFRAETLFGGIHLPQHEYFLALYTDDAELDPSTMAYTPDGEVMGQGYQAGGKMLEGRKVNIMEGVACLDFMAPVWSIVTLRDVQGGLIYNNSIEGKNSVAVLDFGDVFTAINGPFVARMPEPGSQTSLIQWA